MVFTGLMMGNWNTDVATAERYSEKIKAGLIQFKKTSQRYHVKIIRNFTLYQSGVVMNRETNTITTLTYSESLKMREENERV